MTQAIKIKGLREFQRGLKATDRDLPKALRLAFNESADIVVSDARPRVPSRSGRASGSIRARSTQTKARVTAGGARAPYYPWLDFGGRVGRRNSVHRPYVGKNGRYLYVSFFANRDKFEESLSDGLVKVATAAGLAVDRG